MKKETIFVSFSGGRTSAYMSHYLKKNWSHKYTFIFVFAKLVYIFESSGGLNDAVTTQYEKRHETRSQDCTGDFNLTQFSGKNSDWKLSDSAVK